MTETKFRHAAGFGAYVKATMERRHPVRGTYEDNGRRYCAECAFPVVEAKENDR